jgi:hypothetical protein
MMNILSVQENESFLKIKTKSDYVLDIAYCHLLNCFKVILWAIEELFIISNLNYDGNIEDLLKESIEDEWNSMTKMHSFRRRSTTSVEIK